jgi:hypothetical protein
MYKKKSEGRNLMVKKMLIDKSHKKLVNIFYRFSSKKLIFYLVLGFNVNAADIFCDADPLVGAPSARETLSKDEFNILCNPTLSDLLNLVKTSNSTELRSSVLPYVERHLQPAYNTKRQHEQKWHPHECRLGITPEYFKKNIIPKIFHVLDVEYPVEIATGFFSNLQENYGELYTGIQPESGYLGRSIKDRLKYLKHKGIDVKTSYRYTILQHPGEKIESIVMEYYGGFDLKFKSPKTVVPLLPCRKNSMVVAVETVECFQNIPFYQQNPEMIVNRMMCFVLLINDLKEAYPDIPIFYYGASFGGFSGALLNIILSSGHRFQDIFSDEYVPIFQKYFGFPEHRRGIVPLTKINGIITHAGAYEYLGFNKFHKEPERKDRTPRILRGDCFPKIIIKQLFTHNFDDERVPVASVLDYIAYLNQNDSNIQNIHFYVSPRGYWQLYQHDIFWKNSSLDGHRDALDHSCDQVALSFIDDSKYIDLRAPSTIRSLSNERLRHMNALHYGSGDDADVVLDKVSRQRAYLWRLYTVTNPLHFVGDNAIVDYLKRPEFEDEDFTPGRLLFTQRQKLLPFEILAINLYGRQSQKSYQASLYSLLMEHGEWFLGQIRARKKVLSSIVMSSLNSARLKSIHADIPITPEARKPTSEVIADLMRYMKKASYHPKSIDAYKLWMEDYACKHVLISLSNKQLQEVYFLNLLRFSDLKKEIMSILCANYDVETDEIRKIKIVYPNQLLKNFMIDELLSFISEDLEPYQGNIIQRIIKYIKSIDRGYTKAPEILDSLLDVLKFTSLRNFKNIMPIVQTIPGWHKRSNEFIDVHVNILKRHPTYWSKEILPIIQTIPGWMSRSSDIIDGLLDVMKTEPTYWSKDVFTVAQTVPGWDNYTPQFLAIFEKILKNPLSDAEKEELVKIIESNFGIKISMLKSMANDKKRRCKD